MFLFEGDFSPGLGQVITCFSGGDPELFKGSEAMHVPESNAARAAVYGPTRDLRSTEQINKPGVEVGTAKAGKAAIVGNLMNCLAAH